MPISPTKVWAFEEGLASSDLNDRFANIESKVLPAASQSDVNTMTSQIVGLHPNHNLIVLGTQQTTTTLASRTFTDIPAGVRKIHIIFSGVSTSGTSNVMIQIGVSGTPETSGYLGSASTITTATPATGNFTSGFGVTATTIVGMLLHGFATLTLMNSSTNTWACTSLMGHSNAATLSMGAGVKSLAGVLDCVVVTTAGGSDTFDAGAMNISYER